MSRKFFASLILALTATTATAQVGTQIPATQTITVDAHGECRQVTNPGTGTRMVFTSTAPEWQSFIDNPSGLEMAACVQPCGIPLVIGCVAPDGAIYAGNTVGDAPMYVATADETPSSWGGMGEYCGSGGFVNSSEDGLQNTNLLTADGHSHQAADACRARGSQWYLPADRELRTIIDNRAQLSSANLPTSNQLYWTSSESPFGSIGELAYALSFYGSKSFQAKNISWRVRCVRR